MIGGEARPFAEREAKLKAFVESTETKLAKDLARLQAEQQKVKAAAEQAKATALSEFEATRDQLIEKITARFQVEAAPLIEKFVEQPTRKLSRDIFETWHVTSELMMRLCGEEFDSFQLAALFMCNVAEKDPTTLLFFQGSTSQHVLQVANHLTKMKSPLQWESVLPQLESAVFDFGNSYPLDHCATDIERAKETFAQITKRGTQRLRSLAISKCAAEVEARNSAEAIERSKSLPDNTILYSRGG